MADDDVGGGDDVAGASVDVVDDVGVDFVGDSDVC